MEKKGFNQDLVAPKGYLGEYNLYFQVLTERVNIMWREHLKEKDGKRDKKPDT